MFNGSHIRHTGDLKILWGVTLGDSEREKSAGMDIPQFLTVKQAAPIVGVSVEWIYRRVRRGTGPPSVRRGKNILLPMESFKEWAARRILP